MWYTSEVNKVYSFDKLYYSELKILLTVLFIVLFSYGSNWVTLVFVLPGRQLN